MYPYFILITLLVSFGLTSVQPNELSGLKAPVSDGNDETKIGGNFRNLFESITKNEIKKTETYRNFLGQQAVREQQVFDSMKGQLRFARQKNSDRQGKFYSENGNSMNEKVAVFKRQAQKNKTVYTADNPRRNMKWVEKEFVRHLIPGRGYHDSYLALWSNDKQEALCIRTMNNTFQFQGGKTTDVVPKTLKFRWEKHEPIKVDAIKCPARNRFIYESRRERDCYVVLATDEYRNDPPEEVYILYEICELGLM